MVVMLIWQTNKNCKKASTECCKVNKSRYMVILQGTQYCVLEKYGNPENVLNLFSDKLYEIYENIAILNKI